VIHASDTLAAFVAAATFPKTVDHRVDFGAEYRLAVWPIDNR
jgi:hypothetical protein